MACSEARCTQTLLGWGRKSEPDCVLSLLSSLGKNLDFKNNKTPEDPGPPESQANVSEAFRASEEGTTQLAPSTPRPSPASPPEESVLKSPVTLLDCKDRVWAILLTPLHHSPLPLEGIQRLSTSFTKHTFECLQPSRKGTGMSSRPPSWVPTVSLHTHSDPAAQGRYMTGPGCFSYGPSQTARPACALVSKEVKMG